MSYNKVLIDGDIILHKACFAAETRWYEVYHDGRDTPETFKYKKQADKFASTALNANIVKCKKADDFIGVAASVTQILHSITSILDCDDYVIVMGPPSGTKTFRHEAAVTAPYKGNRQNVDRPVHAARCREYILRNFPYHVAYDMEADDLLGLIQCEREGTIIASIDKDLLQIPGYHYNLNSKEVIISKDPGTLWVKKRKDNKTDLLGCGFKWFCAQLLLGDAVDNIKKPVKGIGPVKILSMLKDKKTTGDMWAVVDKVYSDAKINIEENATLLWILRDLNKNWGELI